MFPSSCSVLTGLCFIYSLSQDGRISYDEFVMMMKTGTDWRKASRQYSRERFKSLSLNLMKDGSLHLHDALTGESVKV
ncbi:hypothetical protein MLD38_026160 [Melastoma candidum]|uniref:Uncharacterized protein n=1 Tax=Melastoma candidum TaxID=119954 RepID=A0ACB9P4D3_9MYRT|nr:hypothetical protein MLD38_026160 [Melastoma candidum]